MSIADWITKGTQKVGGSSAIGGSTNVPVLGTSAGTTITQPTPALPIGGGAIGGAFGTLLAELKEKERLNEYAERPFKHDPKCPPLTDRKKVGGSIGCTSGSKFSCIPAQNIKTGEGYQFTGIEKIDGWTGYNIDDTDCIGDLPRYKVDRYRAICRQSIGYPIDHSTLLKCCLGDKNARDCDPYYCKGSEKCIDKLKSYCSNDKIFTDSNCIKWLSIDPENANNAKIKYCTGPNGLNSKYCREWCKSLPVTDPSKSNCSILAMTYCSKSENKESPFCSCLNAPLPDQMPIAEKAILLKCKDNLCSRDGYKTVAMENAECVPMTVCSIANKYIAGGNIAVNEIMQEQNCQSVLNVNKGNETPSDSYTFDQTEVIEDEKKEFDPSLMDPSGLYDNSRSDDEKSTKTEKESFPMWIIFIVIGFIFLIIISIIIYSVTKKPKNINFDQYQYQGRPDYHYQLR